MGLGYKVFGLCRFGDRALPIATCIYLLDLAVVFLVN